MRADYFVILSSGITILMWGLWGFFGKVAINKNMPPIAIFLAEIVICLLFGVAILVFSYRTKDFLSWRTSWNLFGFLSGTGLAIGLVFYYFALQRGNATLVVPLTAVYPAVTVILSYVILGERPTPAQWIGLLLVLIGVFLLLSGSAEGK